MELESLDLHLIVELSEIRSLEGTAHRLSISCAETGNRLEDLERKLGVRLVRFLEDSVVLTEAGESLVKSARELLERLDDLRREFGFPT